MEGNNDSVVLTMTVSSVENASQSAAADTDHPVRYLNLVGQGLIVPSICLIGMVLNIINFIVLRDKRLKESSYTYLVGLAVADFLSLLMFGVNGIGRGHYPGNTFCNWRIFETFVYFPVCLIATSASVFLIVTVTAERFVFLYWPIPSRTWCTRSMARRIVAGAWVTSVMFNSPRFFVFRVSDDGKMVQTEFGKSEFYKYLAWIYFFLVAIGCGVILIVFNALLIKGIHNANEKRRSLKTNNKSNAEKREEVRLTRTLISVIFLYLIGEIPSSIFSRIVFSAILRENSQHILNAFWYQCCVCIATIFVVCQHSLNFVFYCVFNKRFYRIFRTKFFACDKKCNGPLNSELATVVELSENSKQKVCERQVSLNEKENLLESPSDDKDKNEKCDSNETKVLVKGDQNGHSNDLINDAEIGESNGHVVN